MSEVLQNNVLVPRSQLFGTLTERSIGFWLNGGQEKSEGKRGIKGGQNGIMRSREVYVYVFSQISR
jgi:hypothetical protein